MKIELRKGLTAYDTKDNIVLEQALVAAVNAQD